MWRTCLAPRLSWEAGPAVAATHSFSCLRVDGVRNRGFRRDSVKAVYYNWKRERSEVLLIPEALSQRGKTLSS